MNIIKMLRDRKVFARCHVHGQCCGVAEELRSVSVSRSLEKREWKKEINEEIIENKLTDTE